MAHSRSVQSPEAATERASRMEQRPLFAPRTDIFETEKSLVVVADMPGVDENSVEVVLEQNVLTLRGRVSPQTPENHRLAYQEYEVGDFERSFEVSEHIDRDNIVATVKHGVLRVTLPKAGPALPKKITVKAQ